MSLDNEVDPSRTRLGSIMAAAGAAQRRAQNADETVVIDVAPPDETVIITAPGPDETVVMTGPETTHTVLLPKISTDPVDELVDRIRPTAGRAVDALQVAAVLESDGVTDRSARVEYGYADVFALAGEVYKRFGPTSPVAAAAPAGRRRRREDLRQISHGPLYVLPSAVFPAVMAVVGRRSLVLALVFASGLGWLYAGTTAHAAYRLLGFGRPRAAARLLFGAALGAPVAGATLGMALVWFAGGGPALVAMVACQLAYQLASTVLVFYRREGALAVAMTPAFLCGVAYLVSGQPLRTWAVGVAIGSVTVAFVIALAATRGRAEDDEPSARGMLRPDVPVLFGVSAYGLCSAALLLHAEAPYLNGRLDVAVAVAPLILAMGFVEWRADRFRASAIALTKRARSPHAFVRGVWRQLILQMAVCLGVTTVPAGVLLGGLWLTHQLSPAGAVMTAAHVALAGAYYLAFLLAGRNRFGWLSLSILAALAVHIGAGAALGVSPLLGQPAAPLADTSLYLVSVLLLQALFVLGLAPLIGQVRHYR